LFPTSDIWWHTEFHFLSEELCHKSVDWVFLTMLHKLTSVIDGGHLFEVGVCARAAAYDIEVGFEYAHALPSRFATIVD